MEPQTMVLLMGAVALALAAQLLWRAGRRQRASRGWPCWMAALAVGAGAVALEPTLNRTPVAYGGTVEPAAALLLCWPLLWLCGWRRFQARQKRQSQPVADLAVALACVLAYPWAPVQATMAVHLYAAAMICLAAGHEDRGTGLATGLVVALAAVPALTLAGETSAGSLPALASAIAISACSMLALATMSERSERALRASCRRLRVLAGTDPLTGMSNRRQFERAVARLQSHPDPSPPVLLLMDIDHFKLINDRLGHATGDRALRLVGHSIHDVLRDTDLAVRLGGDEFAMLLRGIGLTQAMQVAQRIAHQVQRHAPTHNLPQLSLSIGLVQWQGDDALDEVLHRADLALYEAKRQGRSCAVAAHDSEGQATFGESQRLGLTAQ